MIGIMDWGIGGLTVYQAMRKRGLTTDVLYFSDSGTTPYGKLSKASLREQAGLVLGLDGYREHALVHQQFGGRALTFGLHLGFNNVAGLSAVGRVDKGHHGS